MSTGILGEAQGHPSPDRRQVHVHQRPAVQSDPPAEFRGLEPPDQVPSAQGLRHLRVPDQHHSSYESLYSLQCCGYVFLNDIVSYTILRNHLVSKVVKSSSNCLFVRIAYFST